MSTVQVPRAWARRARVALAALAAAVVVPAVQAQAWPAKQPIRLVAVFPPGGSVDQVARILAPVLQQRLGQSVVVDNKGGASGAIGTAAVVQAPADGYTFAVVFDTHGVNPALQPSLPYDTRRDLAAVSLIGTGAMVIATVASSPYKTFDDMVKASQGGSSISYGSIGNGSLGHLAVTLLAKSGGLDLVHVPYRGGGPLMNDAVAGHVPLSIGSVFVTKPHLDSKRLRALVVTTSKRSSILPDVPTVAESGYKGFETTDWKMLVAPAGTPADVVKRMNSEVEKAMSRPDTLAQLLAEGSVPMSGTPQQAAQLLKSEQQRWSSVVKDANVKLD